jgi:rubrerythrin
MATLLLPEAPLATRRRLLSGAGKATLSVAAIGLLAGCSSGMAQDHPMAASDPSSDVKILNTALGLEYQAIAAYQAGAESGLLQQGVLAVAVQFQGDHKQHAQILSQTIVKLGGAPVGPKTAAEYNFPTSQLHNQNDVLRFAANYEKGAASAYLGAVPALMNKDLAKAAASILGDEAMHWAVLRNALGENPVPAAFIS